MIGQLASRDPHRTIMWRPPPYRSGGSSCLTAAVLPLSGSGVICLVCDVGHVAVNGGSVGVRGTGWLSPSQRVTHMHAETTCGRRSKTASTADEAAAGAREADTKSTAKPARNRQHPLDAVRSAYARHSSLRYWQIIPVALVLWGSDVLDRFRSGAEAVGLKNALIVEHISQQLGGAFAERVNDWLHFHPSIGFAAGWYYIVLQGAVTGIVGVMLIWRKVPTFPLHRNALILCNLVGLVAFWLYPVAPPRMLPGYHDTAATAAPVFSSMLEGKAAGEFASLPSLHVAWALWVAIAGCAMVRKPLFRALIWLYPGVTIADVLATANHYLLDVLTAPGVVLIAYGIALAPSYARRRGLLPSRAKVAHAESSSDVH